MFRDLIPLLADRFHVVAPDLPGFGQSDMPARSKFSYTFDNIAGVIDRFTEVIGLDRFAIYVFDYGAPTGFRIAVRHPGAHHRHHLAERQRLRGGPERRLEPDPRLLAGPVAKPTATALRAFLTPETTRLAIHPRRRRRDARFLRTAIRSTTSIWRDRAPMRCSSTCSATTRATSRSIPTFQDYFRKHKPPFLAVWGKNDPFFLPPGAEAFKRDIPDADVRFFDTGHFALETHCDEIAAAIRDFLSRSG